MRQSSSVHVLRTLVILLTLSFAGRAHADDRSDARAHYQSGVKYYTGGDYRGAIREFSAAQQLAPADLNNYNLALCYDKLGDAEPAIQYYRAFLDKQPNSDKRAEIEASINRLEAASRSAAGKKADEAKRSEEARKTDDAQRADDARSAPVAPPPGPGAPAIGAAPSPGPATPEPPAEDRKPHKGPAIAGSIGTPSSGTPVPSGDSQLDRVNSVNIDEIRDQRFGGGVADGRGPGGPGGPAVASAGPPQPGTPSQPAAPAPGGPSSDPADQPKKEPPVYKKWWFWVVMGVSAVVVYELATASSEPQRRFNALRMNEPSAPSGLTLMRW